MSSQVVTVTVVTNSSSQEEGMLTSSLGTKGVMVVDTQFEMEGDMLEEIDNKEEEEETTALTTVNCDDLSEIKEISGQQQWNEEMNEMEEEEQDEIVDILSVAASAAGVGGHDEDQDQEEDSQSQGESENVDETEELPTAAAAALMNVSVDDNDVDTEDENDDNENLLSISVEEMMKEMMEEVVTNVDANEPEKKQRELEVEGENEEEDPAKILKTLPSEIQTFMNESPPLATPMDSELSVAATTAADPDPNTQMQYQFIHKEECEFKLESFHGRFKVLCSLDDVREQVNAMRTAAAKSKRKGRKKSVSQVRKNINGDIHPYVEEYLSSQIELMKSVKNHFLSQCECFHPEEKEAYLNLCCDESVVISGTPIAPADDVVGTEEERIEETEESEGYDYDETVESVSTYEGTTCMKAEIAYLTHVQNLIKSDLDVSSSSDSDSD